LIPRERFRCASHRLKSRCAVACAVSAQNEMNFGFTPLRTADTTALFLASSKLQKVRTGPAFAQRPRVCSMSCRPQPRTRCAGTRAGWTALPVWETGARLGKARITSLAIFRLSVSGFRSLNFQQRLSFSKFLEQKTSTDPSAPSTTIKRRNRFPISAFQFSAFSSHSSTSQLPNASTNA